ncbi:uncharacterized protein LAESUDRAFT_334055 [Laetiporus sulphureus 93-53]|uniref:Uncharacterized protein n=1 Tax=Laetiporus sulphureus 93-53 TaxID=1314785 RepID=A0A165CV94_9APHY|nr:uncharacterized protein LAESUDRAFT_334055 [Laetiporus sulphureus 93-53]KZT03489.1 hypothetical protein LAESUDRAFT_334055 [Laetiporus sulphureus 93-53]
MSSAVSAESTVPSSDVHSPLSTSSYEALSASGFTSWADSVDAASSSDDEIVFSISSLSSSGVLSQRRARRSPSLSSEDDLVAVPRSQATSDSTSVSSTDVRRTLDELSTAVSSLTLRSAPALATPTATRFNILHAVSAASQESQPARPKGKKVRKTKKAAAAQSSPPNTAQPADASATPNQSAQKKKVKARRERRKAEKKAQRKAARAASATPEHGLGERPIVDDLSEAGDHPGSAAFAAAYQDAVNFITSCVIPQNTFLSWSR